MSYIKFVRIISFIPIISKQVCFRWVGMDPPVYVHKLPPYDSCTHLENHVPEQVMMRTTSKRHGLAVAGISAFSPLGGLHSAMTVHGVTCFELPGTVGTSEPHSLDNAMLSSWSHNARNLKPPAVSWNMIPWWAGPKLAPNRRPIVHGSARK